MLRMLLIGLMILPFTAIARQQDNSLALAHYHDAVRAFEQGNLARAESLANKAITLLAADGEAHTNIRTSYAFSLVGRQQLPKQTIVSDRHDYRPNSLLLKIEQARQDMLLREKYSQKRAAPPQLVISQKEIIDSDNNGILSGLESVRLLLTIKNAGVHSAEDVAINIVTPGLGTPLPFLSKSLGTLDANQQRQVEFNFDMPKQIPASFRQFTVQLTEKDGLGELQEAITPKQMQSWLPPCLSLNAMPEHSDPVIANRNATLRYRLTNCGDNTIWDLSLALDFGVTKGLSIVHNLNINFINQLRAGESAFVEFTVRTSPEIVSSVENVLFIKVNSKGAETDVIALATPRVSAIKDNGQLAVWQAKRSQQVAQQAVNQPDAAGVVLLGYQRHPSGQINNANLATNMLQKGLGIAADAMSTPMVESQQQWLRYLQHSLPEQLRRQHAKTLHVYIATNGVLDYEQAVQLQFETPYGVTFTQPLENLYQYLADLPVNHVVIYLEAPLPLPNSDEQPEILVQQQLPVPPQNITIYSAAMPGSHTVADVYTGSGMFTARLSEGLGGLADVNHDSQIHATELSEWLAQDLPYSAAVATSQAQIPAFRGVNLSLTTLIRE